MSHMTPAELQAADFAFKAGSAPKQIVRQLQAARAKEGGTGPSQSAVHRYLKGGTYARDASESVVS